jgi:uncharacterized membrane protein YhhN
MLLEVFGVIFWICGVVTIALKSSESLKARTGLIKLVKPIPALAGAVFVLITPLALNLFFILLAVALVFCALGDIGMEINILPGLGLFLFAHIIFTINFLWQSILSNPMVMAIGLFGICIITMFVYIFLFQRYLKTTTKEVLPALLNAVNVYALMISLTLSTSLLLWLTTGALLGFIPFIGAIFFVTSDSMIGIREFHHDFKNSEVIILSTYYLAIFLLSLGVLVYIF